MGEPPLIGISFFTFAHRLPAAVMEETVGMRGVAFLLVKITLRADIVRAAPGDPLIAPKHHSGHSGVGHACDIEDSATEMDFVPAGHGVKGDVGIAGDDRFAAARAPTGQDPIYCYPGLPADRLPPLQSAARHTAFGDRSWAAKWIPHLPRFAARRDRATVRRASAWPAPAAQSQESGRVKYQREFDLNRQAIDGDHGSGDIPAGRIRWADDLASRS